MVVGVKTPRLIQGLVVISRSGMNQSSSPSPLIVSFGIGCIICLLTLGTCQKKSKESRLTDRSQASRLCPVAFEGVPD